MRIAVFDLDGTITRHDTLVPYILKFCLRRPHRFLGLLVVFGRALSYFLKDHDRGRLKQALIVATLRGVRRSDIKRWNEWFTPRLIERGTHREALACIRAHRQAGDHLIIMSASPDLYVPAVARALGVNETICTGVLWDGMELDGRLTTPNRRGEEKLHCLHALRERWPGRQIVGYGNAASDLAHLQACDRGYLVNGSTQAVREAARLGVQVGWPQAEAIVKESVLTR